MTRLHEQRWTRFLAVLVAWVLMLPVPLCVVLAYSDRWLDFVSVAVFLSIFALVLLGFLWRGRWVWLILLAEWCFVPFSWTALQNYRFVPEATAEVTKTMTLKWDFDPVDVYCNGTLVGKTPIEIDLDAVLKGLSPADPPSQEMLDVPGCKCRTFQATETWFGYYVPREAQRRYWWSLDCAGHSGLFCAQDGVHIEFATGPTFPSIQAHAHALVHALQHAGYKPESAWVKNTAANLTPLFGFLNDMAYRDLRIKPALDQAVSEEFGIRESMSQDEVSACWADILDRVEEKRAFRIPSPEWYAINLLGDRLLPFLEGSYMEERSRRNAPSRFHNGVRPLYMSPGGIAVRFLPVFYAIGRLRPATLQDRVTYDAGAFGTPFEVLRQAYLDSPNDRRRIAPASSFYLDLPGFDNPRNDWRMASELPLIHPVQVVFRPLTPAYAQILIQSVPSAPIDLLLRWGSDGGKRPLFDRLRYLTIMRAPTLVSEFQNSAERLAVFAKLPAEDYKMEVSMAGKLPPRPEGNVPLSALSEDGRIGTGRYMGMERRGRAAAPAALGNDGIWELFAALATYPNPALDKPLLACFDEARTCRWLPGEIHALIPALIMCGTPAVCEALGSWWNDNTRINVLGKRLEETTARELITDAIASLPRMAEPLACWVQYLATLDDPQLMTRAVNALVCIHTPEAWAVLEKWSAGGPTEAADAAKRAIETERSETEKSAALIAGTLQPDELLSK